MPKRPKQHQLEDLSRAQFQLCLPEKWVLRDKDKDYGIDCEVELFDEDENSTGLLFYVQLKATGSKKKSEILNVDFKIDTLEYFKQLEIPVLLARYSQHLDKTYIKWINEVDLTFSKEKAKTFRIKITENNEWSSKSSKQIENDLKNVRKLSSGSFNFPVSYSINFNDDNIQGLSNSQFKIQLRNKLSEYSDFLKHSRNDENHLINISIEKNILLVQTSILKGVFFHNLDKRPKENFIEDLSSDILLSLSMCMIMVGQIDYCGKIIFDNELDKRLIEKEELLLRMLPVLLSTSYFENTLNLINNALDNTENEIILFAAIATLLLKSDTKNKKKIALIESFFQLQLEKATKLNLDSLIATSHYNLGNFYRGKNKHNKSISHYVKAKKYDSNYLKKSYYYREIAGVCFEADRFWFSAKFYQKSITLGASNETKSLLGDALMFSGDYKKADRVFEEYISDCKEPDDEFLLKCVLLQNIIENRKVSFQKRKPNEANEIAGNNPTLNDIEKALDKDLLSSLAWFNLGMMKKNDNNFQESTFCFAMSACINLWDIEAWTFAFLSFINSGKEGNILIGSLILKTAYWHNRDEFLMNLYGILEGDNSSNKDIIEMIDNILVNNNVVKNKSAVLRILGENAEFEEIELKK
jgi:tetratricopeptide (TPR) repeat protein